MINSNPDYTAWRFWMDLLQLVGIVVVGVYSYLSNRRRIHEKRFKALEDEVRGKTPKTTCDEHRSETREMQMSISELQNDVRHLPSRSEIRELSASMGQLSGKIENIGGRIDGINRAVDLINEHLINGGKR